MHSLFGVFLFVFVVTCVGDDSYVSLTKWNLANSVDIPAVMTGAQISQAEYNATSWMNISVPGTLMASLQRNGVYSDPYYSLNLLNVPRVQFSFAWWYRSVFDVPAVSADSHYVLRFEGINYRANIWVNGVQIANTSQIVGTFRFYDIPLQTGVHLSTGASNCIAVEVFRPYDSWTPPSNELTDLAISWIDWAPFAPDGNAGLWRNVSLRALGATSVDLRYPSITSKVAVDQQSANIEILVEAQNYLPSTVTGTMYLDIEGLGLFNKTVSLPSGNYQRIQFDSIQVEAPQLRLWWPWQMGSQEFYDFTVSFVDSKGMKSNILSSRFGIREATSKLTERGDRLFYINGQPILIRGGGWSSDLLLRYTPERQRLEMEYIRSMGLNAIRMEGKMEDNHFYSLADEFGILLMPGWACCDAWQHWSAWGDEQYLVARESLRSEVKRTRIHPSVLVFLYSSDELPPVSVESEYLAVFAEEHWPNPTLNSAAQVTSSITGPSGVKMSGPYVWEPPNYWLEDKNFKFGGAFGFLTEGGPGASPMVVESLQRTIPHDDMWPINFHWDYHCGNQQGLFGSLDYFTPPMYARYGEANSAREYLYKAQVAAYESHRAMFEAYSRNKYTSTGLIHWMLNNPWPAMIWHMYDYYLNPGGAFFGIKKALSPVHAVYSYTDSSVWIINSMYTGVEYINLYAEVYALNGTKLNQKSQTQISITGDSSTNILTIPIETEGFFFVSLKLVNNSNSQTIDDSVYWYNSVPDVLDWMDSNFYLTPCSSYADLSALESLSPITLTSYCVDVSSEGDERTKLRCTIDNPTTTVAFFIHLRMMSNDGSVIAPIFWEDNMFTMFPNSSKTVEVSFPAQPWTLNVTLYNNETE